jgi:hypothetical protein
MTARGNSDKDRFLQWLASLSPYHSDHRRLLSQALLYLYQQQTAEEQLTGRTGEQNGRGFTAYDAELLTSIAEGVGEYGGDLTDRQAEVVARRLRKYAGQLAGWLERIEWVESRRSA